MACCTASTGQYCSNPCVVTQGDTIRGYLTVFCTSNIVTAAAECSCVFWTINFAISIEKCQFISCLFNQAIYQETKRNLSVYFLWNFKNICRQKVSILLFSFIQNLRITQWHLFFPFSGQKFAMLELKSTISQVLRSFKVIECDSKEDINFTIDFVLKSAIGLKVKLQMR
jgi:hypothetical protein